MPARQPTVLVVGAGFGGLAAALELTRAGYRDVTVVERAAEIGGVWRANTYPGAACDIPSPYYSYSYAPNPMWPMRFSAQPDIKDYLGKVAADHGIAPRFRTEVTGATFDETGGRWRVETAGGEVLSADVLVPAVGQLSRPAVPAIPGEFSGAAFHSAEWDHDVSLAGKRIAVIGTGASAIQFVPHLRREAAELTVYQRSAPYIVPKPDRDYSPRHQRVFARYPAVQRVERAFFWGIGELSTVGIVGNRFLSAVMRAIALGHLRRQVRDRALRAALTPDYPIGCKRVLFSNDYYPTLLERNVTLVTDPIAELTPTGVRTADGTAREHDVIVYGTGFRATEFLTPLRIRGRDGRDLADEWAGGARAYLGMTVPGFPNMFLMYGPNTNLGAGSIIYMLERQARYLRQAVDLLATGASTVDVRRPVADWFDAEVQSRLGGTAWSGCTSWYRTASGRVPTNWPGLVTEYHRRTKTFDPADYQVTTHD
jgi:cation diffusion facilitator CzcD-associated flavoprotein CzcO